jgi:hypothetical protein
METTLPSGTPADPRLYHASLGDPGIAVIADEVSQFFGAFITSAVLTRDVRYDPDAAIRRRWTTMPADKFWWRGGERVVVERTPSGRWLVIELNEAGNLRVVTMTTAAAKKHLRLVRDDEGRPVPAIDGAAIWAWWQLALSRTNERPPILPAPDPDAAPSARA